MTISNTPTTAPTYSYTVPTGGYDSNGNVLAYTDSVMGSWSFGYDNLNRLTTAANTSMRAGAVWAPYFCWAYDSFGNRLAQSSSDQALSAGQSSCTFASGSTMYQNTLSSYSAQNQVASSNASGFSWSPLYDNAGDVTDDGDNAYLYDAEGRICAVTDYGGYMTGYQYDAAGNRIAKGSITTWSCDITTNGFQQTTGYVVDAGGQQLTEVDGSNNWKHTNIYANGKQIGTYDAQGLHFYIDDPLGTRRAQVSAAGILEATYQSLPFGDGLNSIPYVTGAEDPTENHFTGKERDTESGNDYMFARYYNSATGRFLSPDWDAKSDDPVPYAKLDNPQSLNLYSYVYNNPLARADTDGHCPQCAALPLLPEMGPVGWAIGGVIVAGIVYEAIHNYHQESAPATPAAPASPTPSTAPAAPIGATPPPRTAQDPLPRNEHGRPIPDPEAAGRAHTQLGTATGRRVGTYPQAREFGADGKPVKDIDFTDHGRPETHPDNPHQHRYRPKDGKRMPQEPVDPKPPAS